MQNKIKEKQTHTHRWTHTHSPITITTKQNQSCQNVPIQNMPTSLNFFKNSRN